MEAQRGANNEGGTWVNCKRTVVVPEEDLRRKVLWWYHDQEAAGHPGIVNTIVAMGRDYWWLMMKKFVVQYMKGYAVCQSTKLNTV